MSWIRLGFPAMLICCAAFAAVAGAMPRYKHIFAIIAENKGFDQIIGRPDAPKLNGFAKKYGLATRYCGVVHPSEGNCVALLGGDSCGIHDDAVRGAAQMAGAWRLAAAFWIIHATST